MKVYQSFEEYQHCELEPWMDYDEFVKSWDDIKHDTEAMRRLVNDVARIISERVNSVRKTKNGFKKATQREVTEKLVQRLRGFY
jgi:hypothetical protein